MFTRKHRIYVAAVACALSVFAGSAAEAGRKPGAAAGSGSVAATAAPRSTTLAAGKLGGVDGMHIPTSSSAAELVLAAGKMGGASGMDRAGDGRNSVQLNGIPMPDGLVLAAGKLGGAGGMDISISKLPDELVLAGGAAGGIVGSWK